MNAATPMDDRQLIDAYARDQSEVAFRTLVERHAGLVHASALRQMGDAQLAEDVAQAVFTLLARKAGSLPRGTVLSGWLFQTTRFVASRAMRGERRRLRREQEAFEMQQLQVNDETWRRLAPVVDEALAGLHAVDRDALLLRYVEGRDFREVSAALGVSEEAARKRVTRALERLRLLLDGHGVAVSLALLGTTLAGPLATAAPAALVDALARGALVSSSAAGSATASALVKETLAAWRWLRWRWIGGLAAVVVLTGAVAFKLTLGTEDLEVSAPGPEPSLSVGSAGADVASPALLPSVPFDINAQGSLLSLRVVDANSSAPISQARVVVSVWPGTEGENPISGDLVADGQGVCGVAYARGAGRIDVGVIEPGYAARYATWPSEGHSAIPSAYTLRLARVTNSMGGVVLDPGGRPLPGVAIWFQGHDFGDSAHRERPRERFGFIDAVEVARTGVDGRWSLALVPPGHPGFQLEARHAEFATTPVISSPAQRSLDELEPGPLQDLWRGRLRTTLAEAFTLAGQVVDERHAPIAGARVQQREDSAVWTTDQAGRFQVPKLTVGEWPFTVTADGFAPCRTNALIGPAGGTALVMLRTGAVLRLRVVDEGGHEVPDAEVGLERWGPDRMASEWRQRTDFNGIIEWNSAPPDAELELFARKVGYCWTRDILVRADGREHRIELHRTLTVHGRVVDADTGRGIADFRAVPGYGGDRRFHESELHWYGGSTVRGTNGLFQLTFDEKSYPWQLRLTAEGYEDWVSGPLRSPFPLMLDIAMTPSRPEQAVRGVVLRVDGTAAVGAQVALLAFDHNVRLRPASFEGNARWLRKTGAQGEFVFPVNRLAHSVAAVSADGYVHQRVPSPTEAVVLRLQPWGRVEGVVDSAAAALGVATVELYDPTSDNYQGRVSLLGQFSVKPDGDRAFVFAAVPPGEYSVFVNSGVGIPCHHQTPVTVRPGETVRVTLSEGPGTRVVGILLPPPGRAVQWAADFVVSQLYADLPQASRFIDPGPAEEQPWRELEFWTSAAGREQVNTPRVYSAMVRGDGSFQSVEPLPAGSYRFTTVFKNASVTRSIVIGADQPEKLDLGSIQLQ